MARYRVFGIILSTVVCVCCLCSYACGAESDGPDSDGYVDSGIAASETPAVVDDVSDAVAPLALSPVVQLSDAADGLVGCYFSADCAFGSGMLFYVSPDKIDFLRIDADGYIYNCSDATIYLAVVGDTQTYTISASRFSRFTYRSNNHTTADLQLRANDSTNLPSGDSAGSPLSTTSIILVCAGIFLLFTIISRRAFSYG